MNAEQIRHVAELWGSALGRETEDEVWMACPFAPFGGHSHTVDQKPTSFSLKIADPSVGYCFVCGHGGSAIQIAKALAVKDPAYSEAVRFIQEADLGVYVPPEEEPVQKAATMDSSVLWVYKKALKDVSQEMKDRGVIQADVAKWKLAHDPVQGRDLFPIFDHKRRLVTLQGRKLKEGNDPKYLTYGENPEVITKVFYGEHFLDPMVDEVILVEGPLDTIKVSRYYPNVFGMLGGKMMTEPRIERLRRWANTVTFLLDHDPPGLDGMFKVGLDLIQTFTVFAAFLPEGLDPFEASGEQIKEALENRVLWSLVDWGEIL